MRLLKHSEPRVRVTIVALNEHGKQVKGQSKSVTVFDTTTEELTKVIHEAIKHASSGVTLVDTDEESLLKRIEAAS